MSQGSIPEQQMVFLKHLSEKTLKPLKEGKDIPAAVMKECQRLAWEAGWQEAAFHMTSVDDQADAFVFQTFLLKLIGFPICYSFKEIGERQVFSYNYEHIPTHISNDPQSPKQLKALFKKHTEQMVADIREVWQESSEISEKSSFKIDVPPLVPFVVDRDSLVDFATRIEDPLEIAENLPLEEFFEEELLSRSSLQGGILQLRSVINHHSQHYWSFFTRIGNTDRWVGYDDSKVSLIECTFAHVAKIAGNVGRIFNYELHLSQGIA